MDFSQDKLRTAGDWSPPERNYSFVCPDRRNWLSTVPAGSIPGSFFISSLEGGGRGAVAYGLENGTWLQDLATPIPGFSSSSNLQLVESDGKHFVFSEQQRDQWVDRLCIDELEFLNPKAGLLTCRWRSFVKVKKSGGRGFQVHPEHTCIESDGKHFVFSEQQRDQWVDRLCIDELEFLNPKAGLLTCRWRSFVKVKKSGGRGLQVHPEHTCIGFGEGKLGILNPLRKQLNILLASLSIAILPIVACAEHESMDSLSSNWIPSISWESLDIVKAVAGTVLAGVVMILAARCLRGIFRGRQAPGDQFDIPRGLLNSGTPTKSDSKWAILAAIPA